MSNIENLTAMVVFARVVETMSFTEASKSLQLSKSSVSREIAQLEIRLGTPLLKRTTRKIEVTEVGLSYYQYCQRILNEAKNAERFIRNFHEEPIGHLRLVAPVSFGCQYIMPVLNNFISGSIHVNVDLDLTDRPVNMTEDHCDIAIVIGRTPPDHSLLKPLIDITWGLYATPEYLQQYPNIEKPADLPRYDYIFFRGPAHTISLPFRKEKQKMDIDVHCRFRANNSVALMSSALAGTGIAYLPDYIAREALAAGKLIRLLPDWRMDTYHAWMLFKSEQTLSSRVRWFADELQQRLQRELGS
ncbi:LysR substrate-binding domain-containing protein [Yersinia ruckeri]|uniref:LysR family transcriptional regulator n=1 Tax=Yersinia ruckeri TaxID=29486 RepID=UPI0008FD571C|nr:LysR family transcriptional regulator [Yersinia ruckeri]EKN4181579.1 LysR family transcriptional regulator [Yersinia ruckeri]EKN4694051.1 LysR family transcriptional regulator [Yersinia ruckeri]ELM3740175.1 LysR family transcriptional regulator [Yersinia ruckeri]MCK8540901.1 LysR family transcriptional regulator [Yersinia ruckeri]MCK8550804.1 LysR family transcriptional regulator [Yersinia ruckeri]